MTGHLKEIRPAPLSFDAMRQVISAEAWSRFQAVLVEARELLADREIWNVNSTGRGGGVAEMLRSWVGYARGLGVDMRWMTIKGDPEFFAVTKRLHNFLHGAPGDGGRLDAAALSAYTRITDLNAEELFAHLRPRDVVLMHDPQTAGMIPQLKNTGATIIWRSHVGADTVNEHVREAWAFLEPFVREADACVYSREAYAPPWSDDMPYAIIAPSIDILAPKNREMPEEAVHAILHHVGLLVDGDSQPSTPAFTHHDGTPGRVDHMCEMLSTGPPPRVNNPLVVQVSRWDDLKDPIGVMHGFAEHTIDGTQAHLVLAGPTVHSIADDPDSADVLNRVEAAWRDLPHSQRGRVHLACLPMHDVDENAAIVNALQRKATIVVQKSLKEGFGLTVTEAMWKSRPVVASAVGGIGEQIADGESGVLLSDPTNLESFGLAALDLLRNPERATRIGQRAHVTVLDRYLEDRHTAEYVSLFKRLLD